MAKAVRHILKAVPWLRRLAAGLAPRRPAFDSGVSLCGICGGQSGTGTGFSSSTSVFPSQFHSTGAPLLGRGQKIIIIFIFITGLHNKPHGCSESVASAAGPFTAKKRHILICFPERSNKIRTIPSPGKLTACILSRKSFNQCPSKVRRIFGH
jgi:hypothetical protein